MSRAGTTKGWLLLVISLGISAIFIEIGARIVHAFAESALDHEWISSIISDQAHLDSYEIPDPKFSMHWRLKPNFRSSKLLKETTEYFDKRTITQLSASHGSAKIRINNDGFRGPDIGPDSVSTRILMLGDSVTFGGKQITYPQKVSDILMLKGNEIDVINAGVEGYSLRNLLLEMRRYTKLYPDVVTVLIGWNDIFSWRTLGSQWERYFRTVWLARMAWATLERTYLGASEYANNALRKEHHYSKEFIDTATVAVSVSDYKRKLTELVSQLKPSGADVILLTLPSLFEFGIQPSEKAMTIGHLPKFTTNPNALAGIVSQFNAAIRDVAVENDLMLIDTAQWSSDNLSPKENYFKDTVHLNANGLTLIAEFLASALADRLSLPNK